MHKLQKNIKFYVSSFHFKRRKENMPLVRKNLRPIEQTKIGEGVIDRAPFLNFKMSTIDLQSFSHLTPSPPRKRVITQYLEVLLYEAVLNIDMSKICSKYNYNKAATLLLHKIFINSVSTAHFSCILTFHIQYFEKSCLHRMVGYICGVF